jgi:hypothetical protein
MIKYLQNSNLKFSIDLNPFVWGFKFLFHKPTRTDPDLHMIYVRILLLSILLIIDSGHWIPWEETIPVATTKDEL